MSMLETERLLICKADKGDADFFFELLNSPNWVQFIGDRGIKSKKDAIIYIEKSLIYSYKTNGYGLYKMISKMENKPIGICGFIKRDYLEHVDIGFAILPEYEGKGFTYEAAKKTIEYGTSTLKLHPILGITTAKNTKSRNLLQKIGLVQVDTIVHDDDELLLYSNE